MSAERKLMGTTDAAGVTPNYIEDVFSTYLYTGTGAAQTINNGIDLSGKGGLVWTKCRSYLGEHILIDTVNPTKYLSSNQTTAAQTGANTYYIPSFTASGYNIAAYNYTEFNNSSQTYASWTFRKAPKFFDVVTGVANSSSGLLQINHSLGQIPGMVIFKPISTTGAWVVWHQSLSANNNLYLNTTGAASNQGYQTSATSSTITMVNGTPGATYVAYLFAHDTSTDGLIQCGSYTGNGSTSGPIVSLGWEPQYLMIKNASSTGNWQIIDNMRGMPVGSADANLQANTMDAESSTEYVSPTATGFQVTSTSTEVNASGSTYIYIAIRRGPMRTPTDGTKVFNATARTGTGVNTNTSIGFPPDLSLIQRRDPGYYAFAYDKLRGPLNWLATSLTNAEASEPATLISFDQNGTTVGTSNWVNGTFLSATYVDWNFRRAPGFFDVVCYTGTGVARTVSHNLGVVPEMMIVKARSIAQGWIVYTAATGASNQLQLNLTNASSASSNWWNTTPTTSVFSIGDSTPVNASSATYVAYLFASCPGVSKVGSYTGNGTSQAINCGFAAGARFVLIKRIDSTGDWFTYDTARGMVSGTDPYLLMNSNAAENTSTNYVFTSSTGFSIQAAAPAGINANGGTFIYLAIA